MHKFCINSPWSSRRGYPFIPSRLNSFLYDKEDLAANEPDDSAPVASALQEPPDRDEGAALEEAARDLIRLNRYERRAWSQPKPAILAFMNIELMKGIAATKGALPSAAGEQPPALRADRRAHCTGRDAIVVDGRG